MPYKNVSEAVKKHPNLKKYSKKAQEAWVSTWNDVFERDGEEGKAFAIAYSVANKIDKKKKAASVIASLALVSYTLDDLMEEGRAKEKRVTKKDVDPNELEKGKEVEKEHSSNAEIIEKIALDHLAEMDNYYTLLIEMEKQSRTNR